MQESVDDKITIIEGPPPAFEPIHDGWALGLNESPYPFEMTVTRLRTFNGPALVERCHRAWRKRGSMVLEYRNDLGLDESAVILAVRALNTDGGDMLILWCRQEPEEIDEEELDDSEDPLDADLP